MFELIRPTINIDFVGKRFLWLGISVVATLATFALFFTKGLNYGIDFTGGAEVQISVPASWDIGKVRDELEKGGIKTPRVQQAGANQYIVRAQGDENSMNQIASQIGAILQKDNLKPADVKTAIAEGLYRIDQVSVVGPAAGSSLRMSGFLSMFYALLCILIYVTFRFDMRYSPGAVLALFHDSVITLGIFIITQKQFDLTVLAALLALIGYSNNDTIIVFDRVRETVHAHPELTIDKAVNRAVNETLGRTILTSLCTFLTVAALYFLGGDVIHDFAFTLMVGIVVGTYSSIFIASSLVITITHYLEKRDARAKTNGGAPKAKRQVPVRPEPKLQA